MSTENIPPVPPQGTGTPIPNTLPLSTTAGPIVALTPPKQTISQETADELAMAQYESISRAGFPTEKTLAVMAKFADYCVQTQQMPRTIDTMAKAVITFQAGREMGIPPMKALYSFYFVNNKLTMYGPTVIERIRNWAKIEYGKCDANEATVTITRKDDGTSLSSTVTMADLDARGLTSGREGKKDTFKKHARTMLIYKAVGEIVRHIVPEAVGAMAVEGDYGPAADYEIENEKKPRQGKLGEGIDAPAPVEASQIDEPQTLADLPTVAQIARKYDLDVLQARCQELGIEFEKGATKGFLSGLIHEHLRKELEAKQNEHGKEK